MIDDSVKNTIDSMDYESMLDLWRNAPSGHPMFQGEIGIYFGEVMKNKRNNLTQAQQVSASKNIGWNSK